MMAKPYIPTETNFSLIDCEQAFGALDEKQALYSYYFAKASWNGAKICFFERSFESPAMLYIILKAFQGTNARQLFQIAKASIPQNQLTQIYFYTSAFLENSGNFKSFGDSKFIPECSSANFAKFWANSPYWSKNSGEFAKIWLQIEKYIFAWEEPYSLIQFTDKKGTTGYYSGNCTSDDAEKVKKIMIEKGIMNQNNRLVKVYQNSFIVKVASQVQEQKLIEADGVKILIQFGEFSSVMKLITKYLAEAKKYAANQIQEKMIDEYINHFTTGNMEKHKQSQKLWIEDKGPVIETNIGFIESYLDPLKIRAEFEGFVSVVNKKQSELLAQLVINAPKLLEYLPWGKNFEVEEFKKPDFTSLEILAFASSGIPVGINIPNYDDVRQNYGFKNVNLGNAYGEPTKKSIQYCPLNEIDLHLKHYKSSLFVIVALHELLGHGSGKLFNKKPEFPNPIDNSEITTFYGENETWHSVFGGIASTYEECRADSVALYLSVYEDVQAILLPDLTPEERWDAVYVAWFDLIVGGLRGLIYFDVGSKKWLQAHIGASYAILKVLEEEGGIFQIKETLREEKEYLQIHLNKEAITTKGKSAMGKFLQHLQVYKSTADSKKGIEYFSKYLQVNEKFMKYRGIVQKNKRPRRITIQPHLQLENGKPSYKKYEANHFDCIDSFVAHYSENSDDIIYEWKNNNQQFRY